MMARRGMLSRLRLRDEGGAVAIIFAILLVAIFTLVAYVIDIAALRADARAGQEAGDFAAIAGALALEPTTGGNPVDACIAAIQYFVANTPGTSMPASAPGQCASAFGSIPSCDVAIESEFIIGPYTVTVTYPIPNDHPLMQGRGDAGIDGGPCDRIAVQVFRNRAFLFGGILGSSQGTTEPPAVARAHSRSNSTAAVALLLLDPFGCQSVYSSGQGIVWVAPIASASLPGFITVDSAATHNQNGSPRDCSGGGEFSIDAQGSNQGKILAGGGGILPTACDPVANGQIFSYALMPGNSAADSYDPADVINCNAQYGIAPRPIAGPRITRSPIDHRYNCRSSYPDFWGIEIARCRDAGTRPAYIDTLVSQVGTSGIPAGGSITNGSFVSGVGGGGQLPAGCSNPSSAPPIVYPSGNYYINCPGGLDIGSSVTFLSPSNVVFQQNVNVNGSLCINVNSAVAVGCDNTRSSNDALIYLRNGNLTKGSQANLTLMNTFGYLHDGFINLGGGGGGNLTWIAPFGPSTLGGPSVFEDLALWAERNQSCNGANCFAIGGAAGLSLEGTFFTPNANQFQFRGQSVQSQTRAQFFTFRLEMSGQGTLRMEPDPERITLVPIAGVLLIR